MRRYKGQRKRTIPFKKAVLRILIYTLFISGSAALGVLYYFHLREIQNTDNKFTILTLSQVGADKGSLRSEYFAELLNVSTDKPTNLYQLNTEEAKKKLLASPLLKEIEIHKNKPSTLAIEYRLRHPIAYLSDFTNTALDDEGTMIPFQPFFAPVELPEITIGDLGQQIQWGQSLDGERFKIAKFLLKRLTEGRNGQAALVKKIDVSKIESLSCGVREIVVVLEEHHRIIKNNETFVTIFPRILRLNPDNLDEQLANYKVLQETFLDKETTQPGEDSVAQTKIIDLRIQQLAFISSSETIPRTPP